MLVALGVVTALVASGAVLGLDAAVQPWLTDQVRSDLGSHAFGAVAALGEPVVAGTVLAAAVAWRCWREGRVRPAAAAVVAVAGTALTVIVLKVAIGRSAPGSAANDVLVGGRSYPSGHAATATVCLLLTAPLLTREAERRWRRAFVLLAAALGLAVAWATAALGFHWASDVVGGLLVAAAWAGVVRPWLRTDSVRGGVRLGR